MIAPMSAPPSSSLAEHGNHIGQHIERTDDVERQQAGDGEEDDAESAQHVVTQAALRQRQQDHEQGQQAAAAKATDAQ